MRIRKLVFNILFVILVGNTTAQTWQWALAEQGTNGEGVAICSDPSGNVVLVGASTGTTVLANNTYTGGAGKACIIKYNNAGALQWARVFNVGSGNCFGVASDNAGNFYVTGTFSSTMAVNSNTYVSAGGTDIFVMKLDASGNYVWVNTYGTSNSDYSFALCGDANGNTAITGYFITSTLSIGNFTLQNPTTQSNFVAKFNNAGNVQWANVLSGNGYPRPNAIAFDSGGNVCATGQYSLQLSVGVTTIQSNGLLDAYLVKFSPSGVFQSLQTYGGTGNEVGYNLEALPGGELLLGGCFSGTATSIGSTSLSALGNYDAFITRINNIGSPQWVTSVGGTGLDIAYSTALYNGGFYLACGINSSLVTIGINTYTLPAAGDGMALLRLDMGGAIQWTQVLAGGGDDWMDICFDNGCGLFLGGDLMTPSVSFGNIVVTHTATESLFISKLQTTNGMQISISGTTTICAGQSTTLTASGAGSYTWSNGANSSSVIVSPTSSTLYSVTAMGASTACPSGGSVQVLVNALPSLSVSATRTVTCKNLISQITASGANSYTWSTGATSNSISVAPISTSVYTVTGQSTATGCMNTATLQVQVVICESIEEINDFIMMKAFPNPANTLLQVEARAGATIVLNTIEGINVYQANVPGSGVLQIDLSNFSNGIYLLGLEGQQAARKLVLNHEGGN